MAGYGLPVTVDTTYADSASDPSVQAHQAHHDLLHAFANRYDTAAPSVVGQVLRWDGSLYKPVLPIAAPLTFSQVGTVAVAVGTARLALPASPSGAWTLMAVTIAVGTAPTGSPLIVDINKNGSSIFGTAANRPTIAVGSNVDVTPATDASVTTFTAAGDYLTVDVDQVGTAGADLTVTVWLRT